MRILITLLGRIGDMILLTPFLEELRTDFPASQIEVLASVHNHSILARNPAVKHIHVYDKKFISTLRLINYLRRNTFDIYIDPKDHYSTESAIFSKIVKSKLKIGFNPTGKKNFDKSITPANPEDKLHFTQKMCRSLPLLGFEIPEEPIRPILFENPESKSFVANFFDSQKINKMTKKIVFNISASKENKLWSIQNWIDLIEKVLQNEDVMGILSFEPKHKEMAKFIAEKSPKLIIFHSRNLDDVVSLIASCDLLITVDTALVHIAAAFNTPIIALFVQLPDPYNSFRPLSDKQIVCFAPENEDSIANISVEQVSRAFDKMKSDLNW